MSHKVDAIQICQQTSCLQEDLGKVHPPSRWRRETIKAKGSEDNTLAGGNGLEKKTQQKVGF